MKRFFIFFVFVALAYVFIRNENILVICAGIAIFLLGMKNLSEGFRYFVGGLLEKFIGKMTNRVYKSIIFGTVLTTLMQSSGLLAIIVISFLGAGFINLAQSIAIILGGNIGTTTGAWLIAAFGLKVSIAIYAMPMLVFGTLMFYQKSNRMKGIGLALIGLGFSFLGIAYMKDGFDAFKEVFDLRAYSANGYTGILIFSLVGTIMTILMQSSHASLVLILAALSAGQITYENAIAMTLGANIGTTITAIIGSFGADINGKKMAAAHFLINTLTGLVLMWLIPQFIVFIDFTAPVFGIEDETLKIALYHTYFNIVCVLVFTPCIKYMVNALNRLFPEKVVAEDDRDSAIFVNDSALDFADTAFVALDKELRHLLANATFGIAKGLSFHKEDLSSGMEVEDIIALRSKAEGFDMNVYYEKRVKDIYGKIIDFAIKAQGKFDSQAQGRLIPIRNATVSIVEAYKDTKHMQKNMLRYLASDNPHIKMTYNSIRAQIIWYLRTLQLAFNSDDESVVNLLLQKLKVDSKKHDFSINQGLDELIRSNKISYDMATSLMNDAVYAHNVTSSLGAAAEVLLLRPKEIGLEVSDFSLEHAQETREIAA